MTPTLAVQIEKLKRQYPWRSYQSICAQLGKGGAEAKRKKAEQAKQRREKLYVTSWATKYENY